MSSSQRIEPFKERAREQEFDGEFMSEVMKMVTKLRGNYISPDNEHRLHHGMFFQAHHSSDPGDVTSIEEHSAFLTIEVERIANGDIAIYPQKINELIKALHEQFSKSFYEMINESCDKNGNTIKGSDKPFPEQVLEMLSRIEFGVNKDGKPTKPSIVVGEAMGKRTIDELEAAGEEFRARFDAVVAAKEEEALLRESQRKSRFKIAPED